MTIRSRLALVAMAFLFSAGTGAAIAGGGQACLNKCSADYMFCVKGGATGGIGLCKAKLASCKASCGA